MKTTQPKANQILALLAAAIVILGGTKVEAASFTAVTTGTWFTDASLVWGLTKASQVGTITATTSSATVTGSGTSFNTVLAVGDSIYNSTGVYLGRVTAIGSATSLTLSANSLAAATASAWSSARPPGAGDDVTINGGVTVTIAAATVCNSLVINSTGTLAANNAMTVSGATTINGSITTSGTTGTKQFADVTIGSGGTLGNAGNAAFTITGNLTNNGTLNYTGNGRFTFTGVNKTIAGSNPITIALVTVSGTGAAITNTTSMTFPGNSGAGLTATTPGVFVNQGTANITYSGGVGLTGTGTFINDTTGILNISGGSSAPDVTAMTCTAAGNTVNYSASGQSMRATTYHHLGLSGSGAKSGNVTTVNGNLTLSGTPSWQLGIALTIGGNLTIGTGSSVNISSFSFSVGGATSITGTLSNGGGSAPTLSFGGDFTLNSGGSFSQASGQNVTFKGNISHSGTTFSTTLNGTLNGTSAQTVLGANAITFASLTINNASGVTLTKGPTVSGTLTLTSGTVSSANNVTLASGATISRATGNLDARPIVGANLNLAYTGSTAVTMDNEVPLTSTGTGILTVNNTSATGVTLDSTVGTCALGSGTHVIGSGAKLTVTSGGILKNAGTITTTGTLVFTGTGKYQHNFTTTAGTIPTATWATTSTCEIISYTTDTSPPSGLGQIFGNFTWNCTNQTGNIGLGGALTNVTGNFTIARLNTATLRLASSQSTILAIGGNLGIQQGILEAATTTGSPTINVAGDLAMAGGTLDLGNGGTAGTITLNVSGNVSVPGGATLKKTTAAQTGNINFAKSGTQTFISGGTISGAIGWTVNSSSTLDAGTNVISGTGTFNLASGAGIITAHTGGLNGNITVSGTKTFSSGANYTYHGIAPQVTGAALPATVNNLTINNSSGVTLSGGVTVNGALALISGRIAAGANTLSLGSAATVSGAGPGQYVFGKVSRSFNTGSGQSFSFPIGDSAIYAPVLIDNMNVGAAGTLTVNTASGAPAEGLAGSGVDSSKHVNRYWTATAAALGASQYDVTLNFDPADVDGGASAGNFIIAKYSSGAWSNPTTTDKLPTSTKAAGLASFSDFVIGEPCSLSAPAPSNGGPICSGNTLNLFANASAGSYSWSGPNGFTSSAQNPTIANATTAASGLYSLTITIGSCQASGNTSATVDSGPAAFAVTAGGNYCSGGPGVAVGLSGSASGVDYLLRTNGVYSGLTLAGTGSALDFGNQAAAGAYTVVASNTTTTCTAVMPGSATVVIDQAPAIATEPVDQTGCSGQTASFTVSATGASLAYQWQRDGTNIVDGPTGNGSILAGVTNSTLYITNISPADAAGMANGYSVVIAGTCSPATNSALVALTVSPSAIQYAVIGGGDYCFGGPGVSVGLANSEAGIDYQLKRNGFGLGAAVPGTGLALDFGLQTLAGSYTVTASNTTTTCTIDMTGNATVVIDTAPNITSQSGNLTVCEGSPAVFSVTATGTGLAYQWQLSTDAGATFNNINTDGTFSSYTNTAGALADNGAQYQVIVTGTCAPSATNSPAMTLTVNPAPVGGTATPAASTLCMGSSTTITLTGYTGTIQWQKRTGANAFANISGETNDILNTGALTTTTDFRAMASSGICAPVFSTTNAITVNPASAGGAASAAASAVFTGTGTTINLTGNTGSIQWQADGGTGFTNISGETSSSLNLGNMTRTTSYRAVVTSGVCSPANSSTATVTVATGYKITNSAVTVGAGASTDLTLTLVDSSGNAVSGLGGARNFSFGGLDASPGGNSPTINGTALGSTTSVTLSAGGTATITLIAYNLGTISLTATDSAGLSTASPGGATSSITVTGAGITALRWMTQPGSITYGSSFSTPPVLKTVDQYGNPSTTGLPGTYTVTAAHSAGSGALVGTTTYNIGTAGSNGVITFTDLKINAAGAGNQLTATAAGYGSPVAGMAVWLDANDDTTVTASGGQVTAWNDKSGNGRNFTAQGPGTAAYGYSTQSGLTTRRIVAFNNKEVKNTSFNYTGSTLSMFAVFRRTGATFNYPIITSTYNGSANDYQSTGSYSLDLGPGQNTARLVRNEGACADAVASAADYSTQYYVASSVFTGTQNTLWINGTSMGNGGCVGAFNILGTSLGAGLDGSGNIRGASQSEVAEMLIYTSALSTVDRQAIETYLNNKWQTGASLPNLSATTLSFTVDPAPLSITASNQSKTYGQTLTLGPGSTAFSSAGLVSGDAIGSVTMAVDNNGDLGTAPVGAGYTLTPSAPTGGAFSAANYSITYTNGILTVNPAALSITATNQSKTYGQTVTFGSGSAAFISAGLQNGETIGSVTLACSGGAATAPVSGSPYAITPSDAIGGTFATNNYNITYIPGALTISPAPAGVTVSSSLNPSGLGDSVTLTAAVTPSDASGDVVFKANGTPLGTNTLSIGTATNLTATLLRGTNTITAEYSGDGNYLASAGALSGGQVVTNHPPTATAGTNDCTAALSVAIQITGLGGLAGDSDGDALAVTATIPSLGTNYIVTSGGTNYIYYQNTNGAAGTDLFDYTVDDGYGGLATNTITINVVVPNSESQNRLASPETIGAGPEVRLRFQGIPTYNYALEWTHDLTPATTWIPLSTNTADGAGLVIYTNTPLGPDYYRARRVP